MSSLLTGLSFLMAATSFPGEVSPALSPEVELAIGYRVVDKRLEAVDRDDVGDDLFLDGELLIAWTQVAGMQPGFLQHVWYRDGVEVARHDLPVGATRRWRSWSRHRVHGGLWEVRVLDAQGRELAVTTFTVAAADPCWEDWPEH